jgi:hypothetical protein
MYYVLGCLLRRDGGRLASVLDELSCQFAQLCSLDEPSCLWWSSLSVLAASPGSCAVGFALAVP